MTYLPQDKTTIFIFFTLVFTCVAGVHSKQSTAQVRDQVEPKSPTRAVLYPSLTTGIPVIVGGTLVGQGSAGVGSVFIFGGLVAGPSVGHFYAAHGGRAWKGIAWRVGFSTISMLGLASGSSTIFSLGVVLDGLFALVDIFTAARSAREYNNSHGIRASIKPTFENQGEQTGLTLRVQF